MSTGSSETGDGGEPSSYRLPTTEGHHHYPVGRVASATEMESLRRELDEIEQGLTKVPKKISPGPSSRSEGALVPAAAGAGAGGGEGMELQLQTAKKLRNLLSTNRDVLIHEVLERDWIPRLLEWLTLSDYPAIQVESLWTLTNIAAGTTEHTNMLLRHNPVPALVALLDSPNEEVLEQAVWVLGNLAGEGATSRDIVLNNGALEPLVQCIQRHKDSQQILRIGSWALNNLCDSQPRPVLDIAVLMPVLHALLTSEDSEVLSHTCWALSHMCDGPSAHIKVVVDANICWRLVELLQHRSWRVTKPALRTIGNIVCAEDEVDYTQYIIEAGAVPYLRELIAHSNREIQKEACWTLSNIAAGTCEQIQTVLDSGAIPLLVELAMQPASVTDAEVRSEACWVVLNATSCGSDSQVEYLVKEGCIQVLGDLLGEQNMVMMALEGLERILQVGDEEARRTGGANPYAGMLSSGKIEELEGHRQAGIAKRASRIWKQHFVTCAICQQNFSKQSPDVRFCDECKCYVCGACNCTVFHLSYQEELWNEMSVKEASAKEAQQASKRSRKARKKQKEKEKKQQQAKGGGGGPGEAASASGVEDKKPGGTGGGGGSSGNDSASSDDDEDSSIPMPLPPPPPIRKGGGGGGGGGGSKANKPAAVAEAPMADMAGKRGRGRIDTAAAPGGGRRGRDEESAPPASLLRKAPGASASLPNGKGKEVNGGAEDPDGGGAAAASGGGKRRGRSRGGAGGNEAGPAPASSSSSLAGKSQTGGSKASKKEDSTTKGIDLVDYLQSTGSIIALSKYLDDAEDGDDLF